MAGAPEVERKRVVVAMSGGVDSSVAAALMAEQGYQALGVSMQVWDYRRRGGCAGRASCCAPEDFSDARRVAAAIGIPYYVFDFEEVFGREVIDKFVATYQHGQTPNPCIDCNQKVKFAALRQRAASLGAGLVATGHFALIRQGADGYHLLRGIDREKDQSYFLYGLHQCELEKTLFPVGSLTKAQVRERARSLGLVTAEKSESQDICFVSGSIADFLVDRGVAGVPGDIITRDGRVLGRHQGVHAFTVGQRRGLQLGGSAEPLYVIEIRPQENQVVAGPKQELERERFAVRELHWVAPQAQQLAASGVLECIAQLRYRHRGVPVRVVPGRDGWAQVAFTAEWSVVSPGQAAVFYDRDNQEVLGGGTICADGPIE